MDQIPAFMNCFLSFKGNLSDKNFSRIDPQAFYITDRFLNYIIRIPVMFLDGFPGHDNIMVPYSLNNSEMLIQRFFRWPDQAAQ